MKENMNVLVLMHSMERILITGGNGFLGSHLVDKAIASGMSVTVLDDFSTMNNVNFPEDAKLIRGRVEETELNERFNFIVHLAARPSPEDYISNPVETLLSNSVGTLKMLNLAKKYGSRFVYASSSEVYGDAKLVPTPENYFGYVNPNGIRSCYDEGKRYSEALTMAYHRKFGLDTRIQRPFNVYGPRIRPDGKYGRVIPRFLMQALSGSALTINGSGSQTRSFLFVDDWLDATWKMVTEDDLAGEVINVGSPNEITIRQLAEMIIRMTHSSSSMAFVPKREDDPYRRSADISKAMALLKWHPKVSLESGLNHTLRWIKVSIH